MLETFQHPFFDIEIERLILDLESYLVKILSIDGRRFTYELRGALDEDAIIYMKSLMDRAVFSDLLIERTLDGWDACEAPARLKKHS